MSKESIRKKIDSAREQIDKVFAEEEVSPALKAAIESMMLVIDIVVAVLLEKKTRKNSSNSGLPPSKNNGSNGNRNKDVNKSQEKKGSQLENTRKVETSETVSVSSCSSCGTNLKNTEVKETETRKKIDIVYEITEHTVISQSRECPNCGLVNKGKFPKGMNGKVQYGMGIKASILNFLMVQMISLERVSEHFKGLLGCFISQSVMLKYVLQLSNALEDWEKRTIQKIKQVPTIYCDETSIRVDKKNHWIHSYSSGEITLKFLHEKRGKEAIDAIGIIPDYGGNIVHDCWASYLSYDNVGHGLCGAHILRELKYTEDSMGYKWATNLKKLLIEANKEVSEKSKTGVLSEEKYKSLQSRYRNILTRAKKELPPFPEKSGKKGRTKHTDAQNLWLRLTEREGAVLLFAKNKDVDFTNNRAERDLRDAKLKQKVSGTFRKVDYASAFVRISSYIKSMRYRGYSSLEAIMLALQGNIPE